MLELRDVSFRVDDEKDKEKDILEHVSFTLEDNKFVAITGPNGGGKSTMAKIIAGILKPTEGKLFFDGEDITDWSVTDRAKAGISYAFQQPVRFKGVTVFDLINLAAGKEISLSGACQYLSEVGLCAKDYINREVNSSLSGGEMKRIEIATVMARNTKLSVFDEPEAGIDLWSFSMLVKQFEQIHEAKDQSLILISHQERIIQMADRILIINDAEVDRCGKREDMLPVLFEDQPSCVCMKERSVH